ncbi:MAG TPA: aminopeptidase N [Gammaproteobacteria bacterium]|nr:aminopeptidase N [Gammaproteobacteria bacterium]
MLKDADVAAVRLADYRSPAYRIIHTDLTFDLADGTTRVTSRLTLERDPSTAPGTPLVLDGQALELVSVAVDDRRLEANEIQVDAESLTLLDVPAACTVTVVTDIHPETNTALEGLYKSGSMYCTQCEAEGFRRITYYLDRPDVLARFRTTLIADAARYPVLLSNGNLIADVALGDGRRQVTWEDPFPKPSYLFALVAGDLALLEDSFTTQSGRRVALRIYSEPHNIGQCGYAMEALKRAMRWDETAYGREYDLDIFMIVAVDDFNMGAMENKGLNIFNTSAVLASADTATDASYLLVEGIVGHEYFHNWSGNRVTCRDWFQLSLKEGFTVFRDEQFSADMNSATVKRIEAVSLLRSVQFAEDASPLAHPVRPQSYLEISNFYTPTVYDKGAEVVGMLHALLGPEQFRAGTDLFFARHDGSAVTTDDFLAAMQAVTPIDLAQFQRWYDQAGTPVVSVASEFADGRYRLTFSQRCPPTPGQPDKEPMLIPIRLGLLDRNGTPLAGVTIKSTDPLRAEGTDGYMLELRSATCELLIEAPAAPVASLLRGFSAPVRMEYPRPAAELALIAAHDTDGFARWDALQTLIVDDLRERMAGRAAPGAVSAAFATLLRHGLSLPDDPERLAALAITLRLPDENYLFEQFQPADVGALSAALESLAEALAHEHAEAWAALYTRFGRADAYAPTPFGMARRSLAHTALGFWLRVADVTIATTAVETLYRSADNLTDRRAALVAANRNLRLPAALCDELMADFLERWKHEALVVNHWFQLSASSVRSPVERVAELARHPAFDARNPNKLRALYGAFAQQNYRHFHALDGSGYRFLASAVVDLDRTNPQAAARLAVPLTRWRRYDAVRRSVMRDALAAVAARDGLSRDLFEVASKGIAGD